MDRSLEAALCDMQGKIFEMSVDKGYESESFIKVYMDSRTAAALDLPFNHAQWAGAEYIMSCVEEESAGGLLLSANLYDKQIMYWAGCLYRYWHYLTGESSREIYKQAPAAKMRVTYFAYHTLSNELAIAKLKESSGNKGPRKRPAQLRIKPGTFKNDSRYRGEGQNEDFFFLSPIACMSEDEDDFDRHWVYLSDDYKSRLKNELIRLNAEHGLDLPDVDDLTSYDNPDYLWLSYELLNLIRAYNRSITDPVTGRTAEGCRHLPYAQIWLKATAHSVASASPKSQRFPLDENGKAKYLIFFQQPFLKLFMDHIFGVFDDNPQIFHEQNGQTVVDYQFRAPIYRQQPFDKYFDTRHDLPATVFHKAVQMMIAHELAHIGGGHLDLQAADSKFGLDKDTLIAEERDADNQAVCWLLGIRIMEAPANVLDITYFDYFKELSLTVFSIYLLYTWSHSVEDRTWASDTVEKFGHQDHLPYQLRAFNSIELCRLRLQENGIACEKMNAATKDGVKLTVGFMNSVFDEAMRMILAYENSLYMSFARTKETVELAQEGNRKAVMRLVHEQENERLPELKREQIPWMLALEPQGERELKRVHELWKTVRERLLQNGIYCRLADYEEWIPYHEDI